MKLKKFLWLVIVLIAGGLLIAAYLWNKPHRNVEDEKGIPVTALDLLHAYQQNEKASNETYLNKPIKVSGMVAEIDTNQDGQIAVLLQTDDPLSTVMCTMRDRNIAVKKNENVVIKGFCSGFVSDVKLTDCILVK